MYVSYRFASQMAVVPFAALQHRRPQDGPRRGDPHCLQVRKVAQEVKMQEINQTRSVAASRGIFTSFMHRLRNCAMPNHKTSLNAIITGLRLGS